jgi:hypothetical protein
MKNLKANFYITLTFLLMETVIFANTPPAPAAADDNNPGHPELPIDQNIKILVLLAILYGTYKIYKHIQNKKASI